MIPKPIPIELDRPRKLFLDLNAMAAYEEVSGRSIWDIQDDIQRMDIKTIRALLWAGLKRDDPELTLEQAGELVTFADLRSLVPKLGEMFSSAMGSEDVPADPEKNVSPPTGSPCGQSGDTTSASAIESSGASPSEN